MKKKDTMKMLKKADDNELERLYNENNLVISKKRGDVYIGNPLGKSGHKELTRAITMRARVLTVMNHRRNVRMMRKGRK